MGRSEINDTSEDNSLDNSLDNTEKDNDQFLDDNDISDEDMERLLNDEDESDVDDSPEQKGLTEKQKQEIQEKTEWSDDIVSSIGSKEEADIYADAGLEEADIDGKKCLIRNDIDYDQKDEDGITNRQRMERGRPPITKEGQDVELHHIGQKSDSPLAELTIQEHRGVGNDTILHDKTKESEIDRNGFATERKNHWKFRANEGEE